MSIDPVEHGALDFAELERLGLNPDDVLDFSVNSNPFGPSPLVREAIARTPLQRYPDRESLALRRALGEKLDVAIEQILVGNGSAELIQLAASAFLRPANSALVLGPTFGEYARAARLAGAQVVTEKHFITEITKSTEKIEKKALEISALSVGSVVDSYFQVVFLCNPNNPTGQCLPDGVLATWASAHPETIFIVDEAYLPFVPDMPSALALNAANILVLRSMTKDHALAGLGLGYAVGPAHLIARLTSLRPPWNVNALAQAAGLAALQDEAHLAQTLAQLRHEKDLLVCGLRALGYSPLPSQTHFFLLSVGDGAAFRRALLTRGMLVRDCASFGLPGYVRIAPQRPAENLRLLEVIHTM